MSARDFTLQDEAETAVAERMLRESFARSVQGDVTAIAPFAPGGITRSAKTVADVMEDALASRGAFMVRAMQILANAAAGRGTQRDAQQLLAEAGATWASSRAELL